LGKGTTITLYFPATRKEFARDKSQLAIEDYKEAQKLGAGEYIKKPYTMEQIGLAVKK
jgi:hypothetical protein